MRAGRIVLVFPEGTRSTTGELQPFKHGIGYLQAKTGLSVLPLHLKGTHRAMRKGSAVPTARNLRATIGPLVTAEFLAKETEGKNRIETYATVAEHLQAAVEALRDGKPYPWMEADAPKKESGIADVFDELLDKYMAEVVTRPITWYFSLGDSSEGKWTVGVAPGGVLDVRPGRPTGGQADCVLKTDLKTFERIVRERYVPSFAEFADGRIKTNDPDLLRQFQSVFGL